MSKPTPPRSEAMKAALLSALAAPGAGQLYNRQWLKGVFVGTVFLIASLALLVPVGYFLAVYYLEIGQGNIEKAGQSLQFLRDEFYTFLVLAVASAALYVYSIYDAYTERKKLDSQPGE